MLIQVEDDFLFAEAGVGFYQVPGWIGSFIAIILLLRVLLGVLRSEAEMRRV